MPTNLKDRKAMYHFMDADELLRKYFGLQGEYYTKEYRDARAITDETKRDYAVGEILENDTIDCRRQFTRDAWDAWGRALEMLEELQKAGYIGEGPEGDFYAYFWECIPD